MDPFSSPLMKLSEFGVTLPLPEEDRSVPPTFIDKPQHSAIVDPQPSTDIFDWYLALILQV